MTVTFWGTRGSIATPGGQADQYGGNTTCLEVRYGSTLAVLDAGTGIRLLSEAWGREFADSPIEAHLLLTHLHWDHIQGFPFFRQAYAEQNRVEIYGAEGADKTVQASLRRQMQGQFFPVPMEAMRARLDFHDLDESFQVGAFHVTRQLLPHPGGAYAYRLEAGGTTFILATDCELDRAALNQQQLEADFHAPRIYPPEFLDFFRGADLLVIDCQYSDAVYQSRKGWGHNPVTTVVDFCRQVRPGAVALTHHDPQSTDALVSELVEAVDMQLEQEVKDPPLVFGAREGMTLQIVPPPDEAGDGSP
jgi:phosphoribosyl 1,2-cyclic phosphodiesterase